MAAFDPERWVRHLQDHGVDFVLVGGVAGQLHGAGRPTLDIDVVPQWERNNLERLCEALRSVEATSTSGPLVEGDDITPELLVEREVTTWNTVMGRIDTLVGIPDSEGMPVDYDQLDSRAVVVSYKGHRVAVASLDDIIVSKEFASRAKDRMALPELYRLRDAQQLEPPSTGLDRD